MGTKLGMIKCTESEINGLSGAEVGLKTSILFSKFFPKFSFLFGM